MKNLAIMNVKKKNAAELESKYATPQDHAALKSNVSGRAEFPRHDDDYELLPGTDPIKKRKP
jgi:NADH dehydrogenase [ubiquinone] 1 alpha subcomplex assembly factor 2